MAVISGDGRWLAYVSNESGADEILARRISGDPASGRFTLGGSLLVSRGGGISPRWRRDGKELFYLARSGAVMAVPIGNDIGAPSVLFQRAGMSYNGTSDPTVSDSWWRRRPS